MRKLFTFISTLLLVSLLWGCTFKTEPTPVSTSSPSAIPVGTAVPTLAAEPGETLLSHTDPLHGFSFTYPGSWAMADLPGDGSSKNGVIILALHDATLSIEYGFQYEIQALEPMPLPSGELTEQAQLTFLEHSLPGQAVVEEGRLKLVAYPALADVFQVNDLFFRIALQANSTLAQNEIDFSPELLDQAAGILESFTLVERTIPATDPHSGWNTFISLDFGLVLRYPSEWQLEEIDVETAPSVFEHALSLTKDKAHLLIGYHLKGEFVPHSQGFSGGFLVDEGKVLFLGKEIPKLTLRYQEKDKAVFYNGVDPIESGMLVFNLQLLDNTAGAGYELIEVPDAVQLEAEEILTAVRQLPPVLAVPEESVISQGSQYFLTFGSCFDLDEGMQKPLEDPACDFEIERTAGGSSQKIDFLPANQALFGFAEAFTEPPQSGQCAASTALSAAKQSAILLDDAPVCYQTSVGRYGYLRLQGMTSDGVTFDWLTTSTAGPLHSTSDPAGAGLNAGITLKDVTVPDGTVFEPGETFLKTWQLMNTGETTWTTDYAVRFQDGDRLGAPYETALPKAVPPGGAVNITMEMTAPMHPGEYTGHFTLRDAAGKEFGMGRNGTGTFWVQIVVEEKATPEPEGEISSDESPVKEALLEVDPPAFEGACPANLEVSFSIITEGADHYTYVVEAGSQQPGYQFYLPEPTQVSLTGTGRNTKTVAYTLALQNSVEGWLRLVVTDPGEYRSQSINFSVKCQ